MNVTLMFKFYTLIIEKSLRWDVGGSTLSEKIVTYFLNDPQLILFKVCTSRDINTAWVGILFVRGNQGEVREFGKNLAKLR